MTDYKVDVRSKFAWQQPVEDKDLTTSPAASKGDRYIIAGIGGGWSAGAVNDIAQYNGATWDLYTPSEGWICWVKDENEFYKFDGSSWLKFSSTKLNDVIVVGPNGDYTTITAALASLSGDGANILVSEGTYNEAFTIPYNNISIKAIGSKENTTITQTAATVFTCTSKVNIWIEGFTVSVTAATSVANHCMSINNAGSTITDTSIHFKDCDFTLASSVALQGASTIDEIDGSYIYENCTIKFTNTYSGTDASLSYGIKCAGIDETTLMDCDVIIDHDGTSTAQGADGFRINAGHKVIMRNGSITVDSACQTGAIATLLTCTTTSTFELHNVEGIVDVSSTGKAQAFVVDDSDCTIYGGNARATNGDSDAVICFANSTGNLTAYSMATSGDLATNTGVFNQIDIRVKIGTFSRDTSIASGTQAITGIGFRPSSVIFFMAKPSSDEGSWGFSDGTINQCVSTRSGGVAVLLYPNTTIAIKDFESWGADEYNGNIDSLDPDGFTIDWTKIGSPTGTMTIFYQAIA